MYYNPETKETLSREEIKFLFHSSFPEGTEEVFGWYLIDKSALIPSLEDGQTAIPTEIVLHEGRWCQAYRAGELPKPQEDLEARCRMLEQALVDLAQTVSDLREGKEPLTQVLQ